MKNAGQYEFKQKEIRGLNRLNTIFISIFVAIPLGIFLYLTYLVYLNYVERNIQNKSFFEFAYPLSGVFFLLFMVFFPIILFIRYRITRFIKILHEIDEESLQVYQHYTRAVPRIFINIPSYVFYQNGIIIPGLFSIERIPFSGIMEISYKRFKSGRNSGTTITLETYDGKKHKVSFFQNEKLTFFLRVMSQKNLHIPVFNKNR